MRRAMNADVHPNRRLSPVHNRFSAGLMLAAAAASVVSLPAIGATLTWDTSTTAGIQPGNGTWSFNTNADWSSSSAGSNPLLTWTSNSDTASFVMPLGGNTDTIDGTNGQIGAAGLQFSGVGGAATLTLSATAGSTLQLGAGGIASTMSNQVVAISAPLVLTASQTWTSTSLRTNNNGAAIQATGVVSSLSGTTNLTFDGLGVTNAAYLGNTNSINRTAFLLGGNNTFSGTTTVTGGAALWLNYITNTGSKLDDNSALILSGGSIVLNGGAAGSNFVEIVASTTVNSGSNSIYAGSNGGGGTTSKIQLGALTHNVSGTLDVTVAVSNIASTTTINTDGILGGWATVGATSWAVGSAAGASTNIAGTNGTSRSVSSAWVSTDNVNSTASESGIGSKTINTLRLNAASMSLGFGPSSTLTLTAGALLSANTGQGITGGTITTGLSSGELFVHTPNALSVGSVIADNGGTHTILVKAGVSSLTLTGTSTYTGATYVNSGALTLDNGGSLANSNITIVGGATLNAGTTGSGGTITYNVADDSADLISVNAGGVLDLSNLKLNLNLTGTQTLSEYVIANADVGSGLVTGTQFLSVSNLPGSWQIDYTGTASHPGDIVLAAVPEPSSLALIGLAGGSLCARRRRKR